MQPRTKCQAAITVGGLVSGQSTYSAAWWLDSDGSVPQYLELWPCGGKIRTGLLRTQYVHQTDPNAEGRGTSLSLSTKPRETTREYCDFASL